MLLSGVALAAAGLVLGAGAAHADESDSDPTAEAVTSPLLTAGKADERTDEASGAVADETSGRATAETLEESGADESVTSDRGTASEEAADTSDGAESDTDDEVADAPPDVEAAVGSDAGTATANVADTDAADTDAADGEFADDDAGDSDPADTDAAATEAPATDALGDGNSDDITVNAGAAGKAAEDAGSGDADDKDATGEATVAGTGAADETATGAQAEGAVAENATADDAIAENATVEGAIEGATAEHPTAEHPTAEGPAAEDADEDLELVDGALVAALAAEGQPRLEVQSVVATKAAVAASFSDVRGNAFASEIDWARRAGITRGYADGTFRPLESIHRDAFVAMLYRLEAPRDYVAPKRSPFIDVATNSLFYREIAWAYATGITTGWADRTFRPLENIDRDAAIAMLYRVSGSPRIQALAASPFRDVRTTDDFYKEISWAYTRGVTTGWADGTFRPKHDIARDANIAMLYRIYEEGLDVQSSTVDGVIGSYYASGNNAKLLGKATGHRYVYGGGLRQDFQYGAITHSASAGTHRITGETLRHFDANGGWRTFGLANAEPTSVRGVWHQIFQHGGIYTTSGFTFQVTGRFFDLYQAAGGIGGYLYEPISPQRTGSTGITYQQFRGGILQPDFRDTPPPSTPSGGTSFVGRYPTLSVGARDAAGKPSWNPVKAVQAKVGVAINGVFDARTETAVRAFQRDEGIPVTGVVDQRTWARIMTSPNRSHDGSNGKVHPDDLSIIAPGWMLPKAAAPYFISMNEAFRRDTGRDFDLNDAYRDFDRQVQMLVAFGRARAATPGYSDHGDVKTGAVDISLVGNTYSWLKANAHRFGFEQSISYEPWHWSFTLWS